uniref:Protein TsetseEP domain-containing protein n=1 Tax=Anopheles atroparvus TaxID=41427 RepID=A0A182IVF7_ANOAO
MKSIVVLLALVGIAAAARPESSQVITTFKTIAPLYKAAMEAEESQLVAIKSNVTSQLVDFHLAVINSKEAFVNGVITREEYILQQIGAQPASVDTLCLGFVRSSSEMNVNLAGVSFTNCINAADTALNTKVTEYYGSVGTLEAKVTQLRLLDVFKGENVFYTPAVIIEKLNAKLAALNSNPALTATEAEALATTVSRDLGAILTTYNTCMTSANGLLEQGLSMCEMQMSLICGATLTPAA